MKEQIIQQLQEALHHLSEAEDFARGNEHHAEIMKLHEATSILIFEIDNN